MQPLRNANGTPRVHVYRRGDMVALYNVDTMEKVYCSAEEYESMSPEDVSAQFEKGFFDHKVPEAKALTFMVVVTEKCNLWCKYCDFYLNQPEKRVHGVKMDIATAREVVQNGERYLGNKRGLLIVTGGEPLSNWEVTKFLFSHFEQHDKVIFTNGTLITDEIARDLHDRNVNVLLSLDGDAEAQDQMRVRKRGEPTYQDVVAAYHTLKRHDCSVGISIVIGPHNERRLDEIYEKLHDELEPDSFGIDLPHYTTMNALPIDSELVAEKWISIFHKAKKKPIFIDQLARRLKPFAREEFRYRDCSACGSKLVVYPRLQTTNCVVLGHGKKDDQAFISNYLTVEQSPCQTCEAIGICGGGCPLDAKRYFPQSGVDERNCKVIKRFQEEFVWDTWDELHKRKPTTADLEQLYGPLIERRSNFSFSIGHETQRGQEEPVSAG
jgi:uncharacterized protein